jgi:hypothetical protein
MEADISHNFQAVHRTLKQLCWYAVYTHSHHEKKVDQQLHQEDINLYLPMHTTIKRESE